MNPTLADVAARAVIEQKPADLFCFLKIRFHADLRRGVFEADFSKPLAWIFPDHSALLFFREHPNSLLAFRSLDVALHCFINEEKMTELPAPPEIDIVFHSEAGDITLSELPDWIASLFPGFALEDYAAMISSFMTAHNFVCLLSDGWREDVAAYAGGKLPQEVLDYQAALDAFTKGYND